MTASLPALADASGQRLASYYARHLLLADARAFTWQDAGAPRAALPGIGDLVQAGASQDAWFALRAQGDLLRWADDATPRTLMRDVASMACGQSGWVAIDRGGVLWHAAGSSGPARVAEDVATACIGDSADYYITRDGTLFAKGLAHRGQYGDGKLAATDRFVPTATEAVAVRAHTGHAIHLRRDGTVMGTGGNRYGPLSSHGLGDKADRWGPIFDGAVAIATGSRHSLAVRADGSLWAWGDGFAIEPAKVMERVVAAAAGDTATIALDAAGALWQWEAGRGPRRLALPR